MAETDVARVVEAADLKQMSDMDIDDVYVLMDVQLRERPDARDLYRRWERQNWSAFEIDFTKDAEDWKLLPQQLTDEVLSTFLGFFLGEAAVTDTLSPLVHAAPTDEDRQFLSTQLVDEARHTIFFERFFREVVGVESLAAAKARAQRYRMMSPDRGYGRVFYVDLVQVTDALRLDPGDYRKFVHAIVLYHMLLEGMLALQGQRQILQGARAFNMLPGFRAGFTAVTRDESRHVNYGVYALSEAVNAGLSDHIVDCASAHLDAVCDVLTYTPSRITQAEEEAIALLESLLPEGSTFDIGMFDQASFPLQQLRKRLRGAGVPTAGVEALEQQWLRRREANFDEYETKFGEPHPARVRRATREGPSRA